MTFKMTLEQIEKIAFEVNRLHIHLRGIKAVSTA